MPKFVCPRCRREVVADADLEGNSADCARCGAHVACWPAPKRRTRKPRGPLAHLFDFAVFVVVVVLALVFLVGVFGSQVGIGIFVVILVVLGIVKAFSR